MRFRTLGSQARRSRSSNDLRAGPDGAAMFHVKQNARLAVRAPRTVMLALKTRRRTPEVRFY